MRKRRSAAASTGRVTTRAQDLAHQSSHLPLLLANDTYRSMNPALLAGWVLSLFTGSVLTGWLYERSERSLPLVAVFHGLLDVAMVNGAVNQTGLATMGALVTLWGIGVLLLGHSPKLRERQN